MKAIILSNDSAFTLQARSMLQRVGHRPDVAVRWTIRSWPVVDLRDSAVAEKALREGADAHLIVTPGEYACSLPLHLRDWLERWAALRVFDHAAVGVLGAGSFNDISPELQCLVKRRGLNLIIDKRSFAQGAEKLAVDFVPQHRQPVPITLAHPSYATMDDRCRGFGIND